MPFYRMHFFPNILLIAGTGRKVGKTALACCIIGKAAKSFKVVAVKTTPHTYPDPEGMKCLETREGYSIFLQETANKRDSGRMLQSGAFPVYLLQGSGQPLWSAFQKVIERHPCNPLFVVESGGLAGFMKPGLMLLVTHGKKAAKQLNAGLKPHWVLDEQSDFSNFVKNIRPTTTSWQ
jgi:hypothetical protein